MKFSYFIKTFDINNSYVLFLSIDGVPLSLTYFIQYDTTFGSTKQTNIKSNKEIKFVRTCAKKQVGQGKDLHCFGKSI